MISLLLFLGGCIVGAAIVSIIWLWRLWLLCLLSDRNQQKFQALINVMDPELALEWIEEQERLRGWK
jgi:hypothetical protein